VSPPFQFEDLRGTNLLRLWDAYTCTNGVQLMETFGQTLARGQVPLRCATGIKTPARTEGRIDSMSDSDRLMAILLFPVMVIYFFYEIQRGWRVLHGAGYIPSVRNRIQQWLVKLVGGKQSENEFIKKMINNPKIVHNEAKTSLIGGIFSIVLFSWFFIMALIK
jgi:hypothetical protein